MNDLLGATRRRRPAGLIYIFSMLRSDVIMTRLLHTTRPLQMGIQHAGFTGASARVLSTPGTLDFLTPAR